MDYAIFPLAVMGFIFGLSAYSEIKKLKNRLEKLENEMEIRKK